jgi:hypothetical protein
LLGSEKEKRQCASATVEEEQAVLLSAARRELETWIVVFFVWPDAVARL